MFVPERVSDPLRGYRAHQIVFNVGIGGDILIRDLNTYEGFPVSLDTFRGAPHCGPGNRKFFWLIHQGKQQDSIISQSIRSDRAHNQTAVLKKRHRTAYKHRMGGFYLSSSVKEQIVE